MQNMAEARQLHKSALTRFLPFGKNGRAWRSSFWRRPLRLGFRNVLHHQWTTGCADAQGLGGAPVRTAVALAGQTA
jgi:hypothetical protein